jgi:hypothetical protein
MNFIKFIIEKNYYKSLIYKFKKFIKNLLFMNKGLISIRDLRKKLYFNIKITTKSIKFDQI